VGVVVENIYTHKRTHTAWLHSRQNYRDDYRTHINQASSNILVDNEEVESISFDLKSTFMDSGILPM